METSRSQDLFRRARCVLPGGVNSPVRAFRAVGGDPLFISRGRGAYLYDVDQNKYIDYVNSWGPMIVGHAHPQVLEAVQATIALGTSYGAPTEVEIELAEEVVKAVPSFDMVRFVNSGTEATMSALRLARAFTQRSKIIKFAGCYHGHADLLLVQAGSGATTLGLPDSPGVPEPTVADTLVAQYNDLSSVEQLYARFPGEIAALIVEPVAGNMGVVLPKPDFLAGLREITERDGSLLIFDEVMTGFRVAYGGAQALLAIEPDLTCLGKIIGGGFPVGAYGGKEEIMRLIAPLGAVYQAGTLSGNPVAMTAGLATLRILSEEGTYERLQEFSEILAAGLADAAAQAGVNIYQDRLGSMLGLFFSDQEVKDFEAAAASNEERYARFFHAMLKQGCYFAPSQFEAAFLSTALSQDDLRQTIAAAQAAMREVA